MRRVVRNVLYGVAAATMFVAVSAQTYNDSGNTAYNNNMLQNWPSPNTAETYTRMGVTAPGDAPAFTYGFQNGVCSAADNVLQVQWLSKGVAQPGCFMALNTSEIDAREWGAKFDDSTDDSVALQAAFDWVIGGRRTLDIPPGIARFSTPLVVGAGSNYTIQCPIGSALVYDGSSTTPDLLTIGSLSTISTQDQINGLHIDSVTTMTDGHAIHMEEFTHTTMDGLNINDVNNLWNGIWFDGVGGIYVSNFFVGGTQRDGVVATGEGAGLSSDLWLLNGLITANVADGLHIAGGIGGVNVVAVDILANTQGVVQDNAENSSPNGQLIMSPTSQVDTNTEVGITIDDSVSPTAGLQQLLLGWVASSQNSSPGIYIESCPNCQVQIEGQVLGNAGNGVTTDDTTATYYFSGGMIQGNGVFGVGCANADTNIYMNAIVANNTGGQVDTPNCVEQTIH